MFPFASLGTVDKNMSPDLETLKRQVAGDAQLSPRCFIIKLTKWTRGGSCSHTAAWINAQGLNKTICKIYGEENIECIDRMGDLLLVTVKTPARRDEMVASVARMQCEESQHIRLDVVPISKLPARILLRVTGIPKFLISTNLSVFVLALADVIPFLSNLSLENLTTRSKLHSGVVVVGLTSDLVRTKALLVEGTWSISFKEFTGSIKYKRAGPVTDESAFIPGAGEEVQCLGW